MFTADRIEGYGEIITLDARLDLHDIPHEVVKTSEGYLLFYPNVESFRKRVPGESIRSLSCSVLQDRELGKLEILGLLSEKEQRRCSLLRGLTADEVFERIQKAEEQRMAEFKHFGADPELTVEEDSVGWF